MQSKQSKTQLKILVIGATGAGKSSLINLFYVWSLNLKPHQLYQLKKVIIKTQFLEGQSEAEGNVKNQGESQTKFSKIYSFDLKVEGKLYELLFLDTPGLGDTNGFEKDENHITTIIDSVAKTQNLNAILLLMNGSDARVNARIKYIMARIQGMVPDVLQQNLFVLLSNVDIKPNLKINQCLNFQIDKKRIITYNNQIFTLEPQDFKDESIMIRIQQSYNNCIQSISRLLKEIQKCNVKGTKSFKQLKEGRDILKKKINECNEKQSHFHKRKNELEHMYKQISSNKSRISDLHQSLNTMETQTYWTSTPTPQHNTTCITCKACCHENCGLAETNIEGSSIFQTCAAFNGETNCKKCSHGFQSHVHLREKYVQNTRQVPRINPVIQNQIIQMENQGKNKEAAQKSIRTEIQEMNGAIKNLHNQIVSIAQKMKSVCSRFDYYTELQACKYVLEQQIKDLSDQLSHKKITKQQENEIIKKISSITATKDSMTEIMKTIRNLKNK